MRPPSVPGSPLQSHPHAAWLQEEVVSALDKKYDEPEKPVVYTPEEVTEKLRSNSRGIMMLLALLALIIITLVVGFTRLNSVQTVKVVHPNATDSLRAEVVSLRDSLSYFRAHTDTTSLDDVRLELATLRGNDEQRSVDMIRLTEAYDRAFLHGDQRRK